MPIAVIGAGLAGLACAQALQAAGREVRVFEKAAGPGGRLSTTRRDDWQADLGAQYFTARDPAFIAAVGSLQARGVVSPWPARLVWLEDGGARPVTDGQTRFVGTPRMSAITRELASGLDVHAHTRVDTLQPEASGVRLLGEDKTDLGLWRHVVVSAPAPQAERLLAASPALAAAAAGARMHGCWTLVVRFDADPGLAFDAAFVVKQPLRWLARDSSKPGRDGGHVWVLHADAQWSETHMEDTPEQVTRALLDTLCTITGIGVRPALLRAHRWRFASSASPLGQGFLLDQAMGLSACGDWCHGDRVEGAWLSGRALAEALSDKG